MYVAKQDMAEALAEEAVDSCCPTEKGLKDNRTNRESPLALFRILLTRSKSRKSEALYKPHKRQYFQKSLLRNRAPYPGQIAHRSRHAWASVGRILVAQRRGDPRTYRAVGRYRFYAARSRPHARIAGVRREIVQDTHVLSETLRPLPDARVLTWLGAQSELALFIPKPPGREGNCSTACSCFRVASEKRTC